MLLSTTQLSRVEIHTRVRKITKSLFNEKGEHVGEIEPKLHINTIINY